MGISGLKKIIKEYSKDSLTEINTYTIANTKIAIDSSILLYKFRYIYQSDKFHIIGFLNTIVNLRSNNITPVFVFDGKPPDAKRETIDKRVQLKQKNNERIKFLKDTILGGCNDTESEEFIDDSGDSFCGNKELVKELEKLEKNNLNVSRIHSNEVMEMLKVLGLPFFKAIGEAEEYCAFLQKNGIVDYVLSEDTDSLTFGATKVLFSIPKNKNKYLLCDAKILLKDLGLNENEFIDFCILSGCDYTCTIPKIGPVSALKIIKKYRTIDSFILDNTKYSIPENFNYSLSRELFIQNIHYIHSIPNINTIMNVKFNITEYSRLLSEYSISGFKKFQEYKEYSFIN